MRQTTLNAESQGLTSLDTPAAPSRKAWASWATLPAWSATVRSLRRACRTTGWENMERRGTRSWRAEGAGAAPLDA